MSRHLRKMPLLLALAIAVATAACSGGGDDDDDAATTATPSCTPLASTLTALQSGIFTPNCALGSCHDSVAPAEGLDLSSAAASHSTMVGVQANQLFNNAPILLVPTNGDSNASYLLKKVQGANGIQGSRMPLNSGLLCQEKIDAIQAWIESGAPNN